MYVGIPRAQPPSPLRVHLGLAGLFSLPSLSPPSPLSRFLSGPPRYSASPFTTHICMCVCVYTSGSIAILPNLSYRLGRAVFALFSLLPRHSLASRRAPLGIALLLSLDIYVCVYVCIPRGQSPSYPICHIGWVGLLHSLASLLPLGIALLLSLYIYVCVYISVLIAISLTLCIGLAGLFSLFSLSSLDTPSLPVGPPSV